MTDPLRMIQTSEKALKEASGQSTEGASEEPLYKVEVPANRCVGSNYGGSCTDNAA